MNGGAWWAAVHGVAKSQTRLSDFTFMHWRRKWQPTPAFLPGKTPWTEEPGGLELHGDTELDTETDQQQYVKTLGLMAQSWFHTGNGANLN